MMDGVLRPSLTDALGELSTSSVIAGPALLPLWTYDQINLLSLGFASDSVKGLLNHFKFFVDDSFGGTVMHTALRRIDGDTITISDRDPAARLRALRQVIADQPAAFLVVDGRGPYFRIGTGLINLAYAIGATVVPCSAQVSHALRLRGRSARVSIPLPRSRIVVSLGTPVHFVASKRQTSASSEASALEQALLALGLNTRRLCDDLSQSED
jgi:hypothetical protein